MHQTKADKKEQRKRKLLRKLVLKISLGLAGIVFLAGIYQVTTFAFQLFKAEEENVTGESDAVKENVTEAFTENSTDTEDINTTDIFTTERSNILLVNKDNPLSESYRPVLKNMINYGVDVNIEIYDALNNMLRAGEREGLRFWVSSGYRSPERQRELLDEDIETLMQQGWSVSEAYEETIRETMPVGCSEHATGLAVDIVAKDYQMLNDRQGLTDEIKWLQENCSQYGFILRYPKGKEEITGVSYESWHFRYVGADIAKEITEAGITLEEYLQPDTAF